MSWRLVASLLVVSQSVWACSPRQLYTPQAGATATLAPPTEAIKVTKSAGSEDLGGCYYVWATQELPRLGEKLTSELAASDSRIAASAYAFGEDCRREDGTATFAAMETDFRVRIPVEALTDEGTMGEWIRRVMDAVEVVHSAELPGPRPGRVEFEFYAEDAEGLRLNIDISKYRAEAADLERARLFQHFHVVP